MKKLLALLTVIALTFSLTACGGTPPQFFNRDFEVISDIPEGTEITFWHAMGGSNGETLEYLVDKFNKENEYGITVVAEYQGGYGDLDKKVVAGLSANNFPNIAQAYGNNIIRYMDSFKVMPLNDYINDKNIGINDFKDIIEGYRVENSSYPDGNFYSLPFNKSTEVLYVNTTRFEENGLEVPTTLTELEAVSKEITKITGKPAFGYDSLQNLFIIWCQNFGSEYTNDMGEALFDNEETREAVEFFTRGVEEGYFRTAGEDRYMSGPFNNEDVWMFIGSTSGADYIGSDLFEWSAFEYPYGDNPTVIQQGSNMFMLDNGDVENAATFVFMNWLLETDQTLYWAMNSGYLPVRESARETSVWASYIEGSTGKPTTKSVGIGQAKNYTFDPIFKESYTVRKAAQSAIEDVINGEKSIDEAVKAAAEAAN
jgi:multiple sugar transport system substrate-binding protein